MAAEVPFSRELDTCLRCGYCRAVCPTWREVGWESASPRGKAYWLRRIARQTPMDRMLGHGAEVTERFLEHFYHVWHVRRGLPHRHPPPSGVGEHP